MSPVANSRKPEDIPVSIQKVLTDYSTLFQEPKHLPPSRGVFDHHIPLVEGSGPEMMAQRIIQYSSSSYASPVVLVGKKMVHVDSVWTIELQM
ncbi:hypothetical protein A4A49_54001 [Nicotiana attenuata]|uniref:Uncharacterized protein n=1 Tax=Nicotiana attenuata TaxID=49451 RepID=A0A1J6KL36_NICAT|nr:hypothetical protein A4A49_54001 [Nicotiana attenuata]